MGLKRDGKWILRCVFAVCLALCGAKPLSAATELFHDLPGKPVAQRVLYRWDDNPPTRFSWGQYRIEIKHYDLDDVRLFILNPMGRVVEQINAAGINEVGLIQLSGRSPSELYVQARPSSNIQSLRRAYYFTQTPRVHCFLTTVKAFDAIHRLQDGRILCAVESAAPMEWLSDLAHAQDPHMVIIGELRGERFLMRTRQYPRFSMREALLYQKRLLAAPSDPGTAWEGGAIGYYINLQTIGRGAQARSWLRHSLTPQRWRFLQDALPEVEARLRRLSKIVWRRNRRVYVLDESVKHYFPDR
jgi:hypothetical protein